MKRRLAAHGLACVLFVVLIGAHASAQDIVELRGGEDVVRGRLIEIDDAGVRIRRETGASVMISWDRVRRVEATSEQHQMTADALTSIAEELWRARTRVERGDTALAEAIFAKHFDRWRGTDSETTLVIAEGLLRCRLDRADHVLSARIDVVVPALETVRLRIAGVESTAYGSLRPVIDAKMLLCPALPPVFVGLDAAALERLERDLSSYDFRNNETVAALALLYLQSAQRDIGMEKGRSDSLPRMTRHTGVEFLRDLVQVLDADVNTRQSARSRLDRRITTGELQSHGPWAEAWVRYHVGSSLLLDDSYDSQQRGLLHLAHLPARFSSNQPYLSALALTLIMASDNMSGHGESVDSLLAELNRRHPHYSQELVNAFPEKPYE